MRFIYSLQIDKSFLCLFIMVKIWSDASKNRVYMVLKGGITESEIKSAADLFISEVQKLNPPVDVINDISEFTPESNMDISHILRAQKFIVQYGLGRAIRVIRDKVEGVIPFVAGVVETGYNANLAYSVEEAEKMLERQ